MELENNTLYHKLTLALAYIKGGGERMRWRSISIEGYNVCNLKCKMCPYTIMTRNKEQMSMELFKKIVDDAVEFGIKNICLNLYNEPLLDDLLLDRIDYAKGKGLRVGFYSNATLLNEEKITEILEAELDYINFSFDGYTKETYEMIRTGADFERTKRNIIRLVEEKNRRKLNKPVISVVLTAQKGNHNEIENFSKFWKNLADNAGACEMDNRQGGDRVKKDKIKPYPCFIFCGLGGGGPVVMSNGKIPLCCRDYDGATILGDLNSQTIEEVWNSFTFRKLKELHHKGKGNQIELCKNCDALYSGYIWWMSTFPFSVFPLNKIVSKLCSIKLNRRTKDK